MRKSYRCVGNSMLLSLPPHRIAFLTVLYKEQTHRPIYNNKVVRLFESVNVDRIYLTVIFFPFMM